MSEKYFQKSLSIRSVPLAFLECALDLAAVGLCLEVLPLVIVVLAGGESDLDLGTAVLEVDFERDERIAALARLAKELDDFCFVHEEPTATARVVVKDISLLEGADMGVLEKNLAV